MLLQEILLIVRKFSYSKESDSFITLVYINCNYMNKTKTIFTYSTNSKIYTRGSKLGRRRQFRGSGSMRGMTFNRNLRVYLRHWIIINTREKGWILNMRNTGMSSSKRNAHLNKFENAEIMFLFNYCRMLFCFWLLVNMSAYSRVSYVSKWLVIAAFLQQLVIISYSLQIMWIKIETVIPFWNLRFYSVDEFDLYCDVAEHCALGLPEINPQKNCGCQNHWSAEVLCWMMIWRNKLMPTRTIVHSYQAVICQLSYLTDGN